jgi:putative tricarboxylic transport membrane protein
MLKKQIAPILVLLYGTYYFVSVGTLQKNDRVMIDLVYYLMIPLFTANAIIDYLNLRSLSSTDVDRKEGDVEKVKKVLGFFAITFIYLFFLRFLGFVLPTVAFLVGCLYCFGVRSVVLLCGYSVFVTSGLYFVFAKLFMIPLPRGIVGL